MDASADSVQKADLIICRDLLIHLSLATGMQVLTNLCATGSGLLLATSHVLEQENRDIPAGAWRPLNLERLPFCLPPPLQSIDDGDSDAKLQDYGKKLLLWRLSHVKVGLAATAGFLRRAAG